MPVRVSENYEVSQTSKYFSKTKSSGNILLGNSSSSQNIASNKISTNPPSTQGLIFTQPNTSTKDINQRSIAEYGTLGRVFDSQKFNFHPSTNSKINPNPNQMVDPSLANRFYRNSDFSRSEIQPLAARISQHMPGNYGTSNQTSSAFQNLKNGVSLLIDQKNLQTEPSFQTSEQQISIPSYIQQQILQTRFVRSDQKIATEPTDFASEKQIQQLNLKYHSFGKSSSDLQDQFKQQPSFVPRVEKSNLNNANLGVSSYGTQKPQMGRFNSAHTFETLPSEPYHGFSNQEEAQKRMWIDRSQSRGNVLLSSDIQETSGQKSSPVYGLKQLRANQESFTNRSQNFISQNAPFKGRDFVNIASKSQLENRINRVKQNIGASIL